MHWLQMAILASTTSVSPTHSGTLTKEQCGTHDTTFRSATCGARKGQDRESSSRNQGPTRVTQESQHQVSHPGSSSNRGTQTKQERQGRKGAKRDPLLKITQQAGTSHCVAGTVKEEVVNSFLAVATSERTQRVRMKQRSHLMHEVVEARAVTKPHQQAVPRTVK